MKWCIKQRSENWKSNKKHTQPEPKIQKKRDLYLEKGYPVPAVVVHKLYLVVRIEHEGMMIVLMNDGRQWEKLLWNLLWILVERDELLERFQESSDHEEPWQIQEP